MNKILYFFCLLTFFSCATKIKNLNGNWIQLIDLKNNNLDNSILVKDSVLITLSLKNKKEITFDYNDDFDKDRADSIQFDYPKLAFKKINYNKTNNSYLLNYFDYCDCFIGYFNSYKGNIIPIKWIRK